MTKQELKAIITEVVNEQLVAHNRFMLEELKKSFNKTLNESKRIVQQNVVQNPYQAPPMQNPYGDGSPTYVPKKLDFDGFDFGSALQGMNLSEY